MMGRTLNPGLLARALINMVICVAGILCGVSGVAPARHKPLAVVDSRRKAFGPLTF